MKISGVAAWAQRVEESRFESTCTLFGAGEQVTDPVTGEVTTAQPVVYAGPCSVRPGNAPGSRTADVAGAEVFTFDYIVKVPVSVTGAVEGQRVTIVTTPDPALAGITVRVEKVIRGDGITARRLLCREVVG
jgi:hypothetical protein